MSRKTPESNDSGKGQSGPDTQYFLYRAVYVEESGGGGELKEVQYGTAEEALQNACRDVRAGYRPIGIWCPQRTLIHSAADIRDRCG